MNQKGYFAQYITAIPKQDLYQDQFQIPDKRASDFDLEREEISGDAFYQHLQEYPEIVIKIRDALQKYLGRYPNLTRRGIYNVMTFLREEEGVPAYSPQHESDGLRRLSLLLTYIYHPKCRFLAIDEPELFLHPDMISFLLDEIHLEIEHGKQFVLVTHSPEMIRIESGQLYSYIYFNLKDTLAKTHIIQADDVGATPIIERLGYLLDVNRRAFLYAPVTLFVEGLEDELVYNELKKSNKVNWSRRVFMVNTGGSEKMYDFWKLWKSFDKEARVIIDCPKNNDENDSVNKVIKQFCRELGIDQSLPLDEKRHELEKHKIIVAPYQDVLHFGDKIIEAKDVIGALGSLDLALHTDTLQKAIAVEEPRRKQIRKEEREWLIALAQKLFGEVIDTENKENALRKAAEMLKSEHPTVRIEPSKEEGYLMTIFFDVGKDRTLFIKLSEKTLNSFVGVI